MFECVNPQENACCGCRACENVCLISAITMQQDDIGFLYPHVDEQKCLHCGHCAKTCPMLNSQKYDTKTQEIYAISLKDKELLSKSTSGGAFSLFANDVIAQRGVVFGATLDETMCVKHIGVETQEDLAVLRGSKYVQSDTGDVYTLILNHLQSGRKVLFSGMPCQVDGLNRFLDTKKQSAENLLTVDILCHGVPTPKIWKDYVSCIEEVYHGKLKSFKFRSKMAGWENSIEYAEFENRKKVYNTHTILTYLTLFHKNLSLRPSCYACDYHTYQRCSDITIGDFWGIDKSMPQINDNKGLSLIIVNTKKGKETFDRVSSRAVVHSSNAKNCEQQALMYNAKPQGDIDAFRKDYAEHGYAYIAQKYGTRSNRNLMKIKMITVLYKLKLLPTFKKILGK